MLIIQYDLLHTDGAYRKKRDKQTLLSLGYRVGWLRYFSCIGFREHFNDYSVTRYATFLT